MSCIQTETQTQTETKKVFKLRAQPSQTEFEYLKDLRIEEVNNVDDVEPSIKRPEFKAKIVWFNALGFLFLHLVALYSIYLIFFKVKWLTLVWTFALGYLCGLAITLGGHRMYTHRAFKANFWVRLFTIVMHTIAGQNCLWVWIRDHRQHHKFTETDADPHNSKRGFFFSHIGWLMMKKHPDVIAKGKTIDMSDIEQDGLVMFQKKYYKTLFTLFTIVIPTLVPYYVWNESLQNAFFVAFLGRLMISLNVTWCINSVAHLYGTRPFTKNIGAVECAMFSFFAAGEGWHNYHHTFPWDYKAAELGQYYNFTTTVIDYCAKKGWIYDLKQASPELVKKHAAKYGDGSHPVYGHFSPDDWMTNSDDAY